MMPLLSIITIINI